MGKRILRGLAGLCVAAVLYAAGPYAGAALKTVEVPPDAEEKPAAAPAPRVGGQQRAPAGEFYDPASPAYERLQRADEALSDLPRDRDGKVDWMTALRQGLIQPRQRIDGKDGEPPLDLDVILRNTKEMPNVRFPHRAHTEWLACKNCHPDPFAEKAGSTKIRMEDIFRGQFCGKCHDRVAFITHRNCYRCHSVNRDGTPAQPPAVLPVHPAAPPTPAH
ncbi:c(7)-type cytochrome triheme domain-containing protein [Aromatoleum toluvorans]|uniref:c(7)-type cytochrome triheme domain-containing protein n=1 Tax=Aromatoleum toluvorans TaxID=92002 RepID=UPI001FE8CAA6|nr:c(7)-type cytochrome triheme domain-containing protein [Aromatoleum toluvorans]